MKSISALKWAAIMLAAVVGFTAIPSCGGGATDDNYEDTMKYTATSDTLSELIGKVMGMNILSQLIQHKNTYDSTYNFNEFIDGLGTMIEKRHSPAFMSGASMGLDLSHQLLVLQDSGYKVDRSAILKGIEDKIDTTKAVDPAKADEYRKDFAVMFERISKMGKKAPQSLVDSVQKAMVDMVGASLSLNFADYTQHEGKTFDIKAFFKGARAVIGSEHPDPFYAGVFNGLNMYQNIISTETLGVPIRFDIVYKTMAEIIKKGNVNEDELKKDQEQLQALIEGLQKKHNEEEDARLSKTPEAIQNIKNGEAMVAKWKKENPDAKTTESGLTYLIKNPGTGEPIKETDIVELSYKGMHIDGKEFDKNEKAQFSPNGVIPGFKEGLLMLRKGGEATFIIPGKLGYRGPGSPAGGIGPMETLMFEVKVLDINPPQTKPAPIKMKETQGDKSAKETPAENENVNKEKKTNDKSPKGKSKK